MSGMAVADGRRLGLDEAGVQARRARDGRNELPAPPHAPAWRQLVAQFGHFFARLLWVAGVLAIVAGLPELGVAIFVVVVVNGAFAFAQEYRAERAAEKLRELLPRRAKVIRAGRRVMVDAGDLVVDDLVVLEAGAHVSADMRLVEVRNLAVDTSMLTGESVPERPGVDDEAHAGTFVAEGEGLGVVTATGAATRLAGIAALSRTAPRPRTPLARELDRLVRIVAAMAMGVGVVFFALSLVVGTSLTDAFLFAIGVTVALVPEGLLPTVTLSLARGAQQMAGRHALVRRLEAVETLGSTTFVCTDKTGTLTRNQMSVVEAWSPEGVGTVTGEGYAPEGTLDAPPGAVAALARLARLARLCSDGRIAPGPKGWVAEGDPMEAAIDAFAQRLGAAGDQPVDLRFPFDPRRRRMSVVTGGSLVVKGAPDAVLGRCRTGVEGAAAAVDDLAARGLRVLAVAERPAGADIHPDADADGLERDLALLGLLGLQDPPRPGVAEALAVCRRTGVKVAMITGDHPATAAAIARQTGLALAGSAVVTGDRLPADDHALGELLDHDGIVISRVAPEEKLRIAQALRHRGYVVAMTGDGVNDGPALEAADIGIAMGRSGTDVAREAADLVLLDDDFATIVAAIAQGRSTFRNIRRFLTYHLTDNVAELTPFAVWALTGGRFPLALGVLQVLALDIGTDLLPALALGAEPARSDVLDRPPESGHLVTRDLLVRVFGVLGPVEAMVEMSAFLVAMVVAGWRPGEAFPTGTALLGASGAAFSAVVLGQLANAYACRSTRRPVWRVGWRSNPLLAWAVVAELVMLVAFLCLPPLAHLLDHRPPPALGLAAAALAMPAVVLADAAQKAWRRRHPPPPHHHLRRPPHLRAGLGP
jgi:magnesium-transporting ATPase (P-type)